jgi:hypothetical protein
MDCALRGFQDGICFDVRPLFERHPGNSANNPLRVGWRLTIQAPFCI